jgi:general secretion pathway protein C
MGLVRVQPYSKNGKLEGYRIRPGKDRRLLSKFGLRSGDVVKSVNGVPLDNPIKALEIMKQLSTATSVTVDIERNGSPRSFTFSLQ